MTFFLFFFMMSTLNLLLRRFYINAAAKKGVRGISAVCFVRFNSYLLYISARDLACFCDVFIEPVFMYVFI